MQRMITNNQRMQRIKERLTDALSPTHLEIIDDSHLHVGHPGAQSGGGHFKVIISSPMFLGKGRLDCHKMVYRAVGDLMHTEIHALSIVVD